MKTFIVFLFAVFLTACGPTQGDWNANSQAPQAQGVQGAATGNQGLSARETALAAGGGALAGTLLGNWLSRPSTPAAAPTGSITHNTINKTVIQKNTVVQQNIVKPPVITTSPKISAPKPSLSSGSSFRSSSSFRSGRR